MRICFVCSGNICRSPTAEVVLAALAEQHDVDLVVDSAGTGDWHAGDDIDRRSRETLERAGYVVGRHTAKQFTELDFAHRDLVIALDHGHQRHLIKLAGRSHDPEAARATIVLLRSFDPQARPGNLDVADPYYGGQDGFTEVLEQIERSCAGLIDRLGQQTDRSVPL